MKFSLNLILFLLSAINCQDAEYFSSLLHLEELGKREIQLILALEDISHKLNDDYVQKKLRYFQYENRLFAQDAARYIANPLNAFSMIKRATVDLSLIMERVSEAREILSRYRIKDLSLTHAVKSLLLVQRIYKLSTNDIARGIIHNRHIGDTMTPYDLFSVGKIAANLTNEEFLAKEYLELALQKYRDGYDRMREINELQLQMEIAKLCEKIHDYKCAAYYLKQILVKHPDSDEMTAYALKIVKLFQTHGSSKISYDDPFKPKFVYDGKYTKRKEFELISDVCRGKLTKQHKQLQCQYVSFSPIVRFKREEVNIEPYIALYIDVLSDNEIHSLKKITAAVGDEKLSFDGVRMASLYDKNNELARRISRRIEDMTGLSVDMNEPLNVQNFGVSGGVWQQHMRTKERSNKIAMVLFYMNDDHMDGYTAFPYLKLRIMPRERSALFWFTLKHSGEHEYATRFTQCPVMYKSKWIALKSLYERGQEFKRPCVPMKNFIKTKIEDYDAEFF